MITPENLKKVAKYITGFKANITFKSDDYFKLVVIDNVNGHYKYNPLQNSDQCLELMEKFKMVIYFDARDLVWRASIDYSKKARGEGNTINEAITLAAIAYVESNVCNVDNN